MTADGDSRLTAREREVLLALLAWRDRYMATGHWVAARTMGVAIWLAWQVLAHVEPPPEET